MEKIIGAFSRMLVHSLWQGLLLAVIVSIMLMLTRKWKAAARYNLVSMLFAGFLFTAGYTFVAEWNAGYTGSNKAAFADGLSTRVAQLFFGNLPPVKHLLDGCVAWFTANQQFVVLLWVLIVAVKIMKMLGALIYNQHMKSRLVTMPATHWQLTLKRLCAALKVNKVIVLLESGCMKMPVVIGHIKPVILMPAGLLMSLTPDQAEAILLHELAHIKRNDYLVNFLQHIAETVFFFNPAILWISSWIREERENCCDDMAIGQTQNNIGLAEALISFKQHQLYGNSLQTAFPGKKNQLLRRVGRILGVHDKRDNRMQRLFLGLAVILLLTAAGTIMLVQGRETAKIYPGATQKTGAVVAKNAYVLPVLKISVQQEAQRKVITARKKTTIIEKTMAVEERSEAVLPVESAQLTNEQMAALDKAQAIKDMARAKLDQEQALRDQKQAMLDQEQAKKDQLRYLADYEQARLLQEKARVDQEQALKNKKEAERMSLKYQSISSRL